MEQLPNLKDYTKEYSEFSLAVPERFSFPLDVFDKWGERLALFWTDSATEKRFSFHELKILSSKGAGALKKMGVAKGDKVLVVLPNIPEWWEVMLSLMRLNAIPIPATTLLTSNDIEYRLRATDIRAVIAADEDARKVEDAVNSSLTNPLLIIINPPLPPFNPPSPPFFKGGKEGDFAKEGMRGFSGQRQGWHNYIKERDTAEAFEGERAFSHEPALIYFTSGTTGPPKLVVHTQASYPLAHLITGRYWLDLRAGDIHWNVSDTGWAKAAWSSLFGPWHMGATVFSFYKKGKFDPLLAIDIMEKYPITTFCGPPTAYRMMVKESPSQKLNLKPRHFVAAGEPLNKEIIGVWKERAGRYIYDGYGQTETVNVLANFRCLPVRPGSMGKPAPGFVVDVVDENANPVSQGIEGEIAIKVKPQRPVGLFREYLNNPEETENVFKDEWYLTGDRAYKDEDGYFWFVGRTDDIMLTSGYRIGPFEIESVLIEHPAVKESAVVASPDEVRGEIVKAFIVLTKDFAPSDALISELQEFVKRHSAPYKYPRKIEFVNELPKTISGKIKRGELKKKEFEK